MPLAVKYEDHAKLLAEVERQMKEAEKPPDPEAPTQRITAFSDVPRPGDLPAVRTEWLVAGMIAQNSVTMVAGESGVGKTWFALCLALAVTFGRPFLGLECRSAPVLYLDRENPWPLVRERMVLLGALPEGKSTGIAALPDTFRYWGGAQSDPPPLLGDPRLLAMAREVRPLIVVDLMIRFHEQDENSASGMSAVMNAMKTLANAGASVLVLHHKPKNSGSQYRGSSDIKGAVEALFALSRKPESDTLRLACSKSRAMPLDTLWLRPDFSATGGYVLADPATEATRSQREEDAAHAETLQRFIGEDPGISQRQLLERCGVPQKRTKSLLHEFAGKLWRVEPGPRDSLRYFPAQPDSDGRENC